MDELYNLLQKICRDCAELVKAEASSIFLKEGDELIMKAAFGYSQILINKASYKLGDGITGWIGEGNSIIANSIEEILAHPKWYGKYNKQLWGNQVSCHGMIGIPLISDNTTIGLIKVENKTNDNFTEEDKRTLEIFAKTVIAAIECKTELMRIVKGLYIFVLMPFSSAFNDTYKFGIKQTVNKLNLHFDGNCFTKPISQSS